MSKLSNIVGFVKNNAKTIGVAAASVTAFAAAAVCANKAMTKVEKIKEEYENHIKDIEDTLVNEDIPETTYSKEDGANDAHIFKTQAIVKGVKAFIPTTSILIAGCVSAKVFGVSNGLMAGIIGLAAGVVYWDAKDPKRTLKEKAVNWSRMFAWISISAATVMISVGSCLLGIDKIKNIKKGALVQ